VKASPLQKFGRGNGGIQPPPRSSGDYSAPSYRGPDGQTTVTPLFGVLHAKQLSFTPSKGDSVRLIGPKIRRPNASQRARNAGNLGAKYSLRSMGEEWPPPPYAGPLA
jgi:hypothetical protein